MKRLIYGIVLGSVLTLILTLLIKTPYSTPQSFTVEEETSYEKILQESERNKKDYEHYKEKFEILSKEHKELAENLRLVKESSQIYTDFVASLLHGELNLKYEVISNSVMNKLNTVVVYAEEYSELPQNQDLQKMYLLLLVDQLEGITTERVELWSNKEHALAYISGDYEIDGLEGWMGENSRFGLLIQTEPMTSLIHILSVHERDVLTIGKYTGGYSMLNLKETITKLESFIQSVENGNLDSIDIVTVTSNGHESIRKLSFDGEVITNSMFDQNEPVCSGINKQVRGDNLVFQLTGCNNTAGILEINTHGD